MTTAPRLSICIPTFDRVGTLGHAIGSVFAQMQTLPPDQADGVEVVVCDNASTDATKALVRDLMTRHAALRYERNGVNLGADQNVLRAASHARGDHFWILGSDDTIAEGALVAVLQAIRHDAPAVVMGDAVDCDIDLKPTGTLKFLTGGASDFDFTQPAAVTDFLSRATMTASLFGYLSSMVFHRALWERVPLTRYTVGTAYPQVFRALDIVYKGPGRLRYLAVPIAHDRRNNCSYAAEFGMLARHLIDARMYRLAIDGWFSTSLALRNSFKAMARRCGGRIYRGPTRVGVPAMDEVIAVFEADDTALPSQPAWPCTPRVDAARERLMAHEPGRRVLTADALLHIGYRRGGLVQHRPIVAGAIGVDTGFSGYNGSVLPFETATQDAVYVDHLPERAALKECLRVLKTGGLLALSVDLGIADSPSQLMQAVEASLGRGELRLLHASETVGSPAMLDVVFQSHSVAQSVTQPAALPAWLAACVAAQSLGDWTRVAVLSEPAVAHNPADALAHQFLGVALMQTQRPTDAVVHLTTALLLRPGVPDVLCNLGCAYAAIGGLAEAEACFKAAARIQPELQAAVGNLQYLQSLPAAARQAQAARINVAAATQPRLQAARSQFDLLCGSAEVKALA